MMTAIGAATFAVLLFFFVARRFFLRRRRLLFLGGFLLAVGTFFLCYEAPPPRPTPMSFAEKAHIEAQRQVVTTWYAEHQRRIGRLDRNWQQYHRTLSEFSEDIIDLETTHARLTELEAATAAEEAQLAHLAPPPGLDDPNRALVAAILEKTLRYAAAQHQAVRLTALAADPKRQTSSVQEEQSRQLREVMITESPAGLFTASELVALLENLRLPD